MDLSKLSPQKAAAKGVELHLKDPATGEPLFDGETPVTITLLGAESAALKKKVREIERRKAEGEEVDNDRFGAETLASIVVGWSGIGLHSDEELPCTPENAIKLFLDPDAEWIVEQVGPFTRNRRNFVQNRPKT